ncbi:acyltransferase [Nocardioides zeae]|uniref:Acyltransferase n=1 Tax=Nocardioides imazamoxiresistens TaxID=3231893 RepID=A0ABU3PTX6_9ACTN|nr:acyltransferase [Nocardioides zeae]MDT9592663.1 acyltransferase [Nocardioides zeae]
MRVAGIDLLRGLAVALVVGRHALPEQLPGAGVVGVVMFFALSGYLITGVLLGELDRDGRVRLGRFYARRARRLVPALVVLVVGVALVTLTLDPLGDVDELPRTVVVALTWTANLPFDQGSDATFHLWTLATEEQFYLVWPALLVLAVARRRVGTVLVVAAAGCLLACVATLVWLRDAPDLAYALPTSWAVCFVIGAAARVLVERRPATALPTLAVPAALLGLAVLSVVPLRGHALTYLAGGPAIAALTVVLLLAWRSWTDVPRALAPLVALGVVSYGAYLWNYPLTLWLRAGTGTVELAGAIAAVLTVVAATLSWRCVERPLAARGTPTAAGQVAS